MLLPCQEQQNSKTETEEGQEGSIREADDWQENGKEWQEGTCGSTLETMLADFINRQIAFVLAGL